MVKYLSKEKCKALDELLLKFHGNESVIKVVGELKYFDKENNLHVLIADGMVKTEDNITFSLTSKGFGTVTAMKDLSYERKFNVIESTRRKDNRRFLTATVVSIVAVFLAAGSVLLQIQSNRSQIIELKEKLENAQVAKDTAVNRFSKYFNR